MSPLGIFILLLGIVSSNAQGAIDTTSETSHASLDEIITCDDFAEAIDKTDSGDTMYSMHPFADIICPNHTTFNITSGNSLKIVSTNDLDTYYGSTNFENVRLNIQGGSSFSIENNVIVSAFRETEYRFFLPDVNGGFINVGQDSEARFNNNFKTEYIGVRSVTEESSDFANHQNSGGVVFNQGRFVVEGLATFENCENSGGGESSPGPGGCLYNEGYALFKNGVEMSDVSILDDEGNNGAGIYNLGTVRLNGDSKFSRMFAESAGGVYNGEDAKFIFGKGSSVVFNECKASDGNAGAVYNSGFMKFSGAAFFLEGRSYNTGGAIVVGDSGVLKFSKEAVFFNNYSGYLTAAPVHVRDGGSIGFKASKMTFIDNHGLEDSECFTIYDEASEECLI